MAESTNIIDTPFNTWLNMYLDKAFAVNITNAIKL